MIYSALIFGMILTGIYSTAVIQSNTTSAVPIITSVGSANSALLQFASTDAINSGAALGVYGGKFKVIVDGNPYWVPYYAP